MVEESRRDDEVMEKFGVQVSKAEQQMVQAFVKRMKMSVVKTFFQSGG